MHPTPVWDRNSCASLRRVTGNYDNFEKLFFHVYATIARSLRRFCRRVVDGNRLLLYERETFCAISNCNVI